MWEPQNNKSIFWPAGKLRNMQLFEPSFEWCNFSCTARNERYLLKSKRSVIFGLWKQMTFRLFPPRYRLFQLEYDFFGKINSYEKKQEGNCLQSGTVYPETWWEEHGVPVKCFDHVASDVKPVGLLPRHFRGNDVQLPKANKIPWNSVSYNWPSRTSVWWAHYVFSTMMLKRYRLKSETLIAQIVKKKISK